jgi:hypothetical protein
MPITLNGSTGITFPDGTTQSDGLTTPVPVADGGTGATTANDALTNLGGNGFGFKNRIINGAMMIDQRNAGAEVNPAVNGTYYLDRWLALSGAASKFKIGQNAGSVTPPVGFTNYLGMTSLSAYSIGSSEVFAIRQLIEGLNVGDLGWGTANASPVTLSFWVRSSLTGTFGGSVRNSAQNRSYPFSYTISVANTWEQKSITIAGDTSGTWLTTNGIGINLQFSIGADASVSGTAGAWAGSNFQSATGATSVVGTNGATFYITGVQLEKGSTATSFDYRPYGTELALCQRYAVQMAVSGYDNYQYYAIGYLYNTTQGTYVTYLPVPMRTTPTITSSGTLTASNLGINISSLAAPTSQIGSILTSDFTLASTTTTNNPAFIRWANQSTKSLVLSAEL